MKAIKIKNIKSDYPEAYKSLPNNLNLNHLDFYYLNDELWAYPKTEYMFSLGNWSITYNESNKQWDQVK